MPDHTHQSLRDALAHQIQTEALETASWTGRQQFGARVMDAIRRVDRHAFIPFNPTPAIAYANRPQPIGRGQTISQPYIVALMTDLLDLHGYERVLEVGTGSGYQAAILAEVLGTLGGEVFSVERIEELSQNAAATLAALGYRNIRTLCADGAKGWPEHAPYDGILVTAAVDGPIPQDLIDQLAPSGRIVIPTGPQTGPQMLQLGVKNTLGQFRADPVLPVAFVPLISKLENL